jgi:hypothetical protein
MGEDEEHIRHYMPVLRRIIILVAVIIAIPVTIWTGKTVVGAYFRSHKVPAVQPLAASSSSPVATAAAGDSPATRPPSIIEANAGGGDGVGAPPDSASAGAAAPDATAAVPTSPAAADASTAAPTGSTAPAAGAANSAHVASLNPADAPAASPASSTGSSPTADDGTAQDAAQQPADPVWPAPPAPSGASGASAADALPPGQPISGTVPLPRQRPRSVVLAQAGIPLPRPRPDSAGPGAAAPPATPLTFFHNIFHSSSGAQQTPDAAPNSGGNEETPH